MSLSDRIAANTQCKVRDCLRARMPDSDVCREDMTEKWMGRLDRQPDGSFTRRRTFTARVEWGRAA